MDSKAAKSLSYIYLLLVPWAAAALGFGIGYVSYKIYLPIWILNVVLMTLASWVLGLHVIRQGNSEKRNLAKTAFFPVISTILISMFAGLGPPPETASAWTASATEQQVRYFMLVICGVVVALGFVGFREILKTKGETFYSLVSATAILIAIPLFIMDMLFWGFYLTELFRIETIAHAVESPDWHRPIRSLFGLVSVVEVALTYMATFAIVIAMRRVHWLTKTSSYFYIVFSLLSFTIIILSAFFIDTFGVPGDFISIPAVPFFMPYLIGVNILRKLGNDKI